jgi:hypothetical protein
MLLFGAKQIVMEGVQVFTDHADPDQFWYLPAPVALARREGQAAFTLIKYKPAAVAAGVKGGGYAVFETAIHVDQALERRILSRLAASGANTSRARIAPVPFDSGTVRCVALNLQGDGGTFATPAPAGAFNAVEKILGSSVPSLAGDNNATFSLTLSQEGAIILEQAFLQRSAPVGVLYDLRYTGIRPALDVKITVDYRRVYEQFSMGLNMQFYFVRASIELGIESLRQNGAIKIEITNYTNDADMKRMEQWAIDFFTTKLLNEWFEPTLIPSQLLGTPVHADPLPTRTTSGPSPTGGSSSPSPTAAPTAHSPAPTPPPAHKGAPGVPMGDVPMPPATLNIIQPAPPASGLSLRLEPHGAGGGITERLTVVGGHAPRVRVDGADRPLDASRQFTVDVQAGTTHEIVVTDPAEAAHADEFFLFFEFDKPSESWVAGQPPTGANAEYTAYTTGTPSDSRFQNNSTRGSENASNGRPQPDPDGPVPASSPHGRAALQAWLATLSDPKQVQLIGHASYEDNTTGTARTAQQAHNYRLSGRRADVAKAIIGSTATIQQPIVWDGEEAAHHAGGTFDDHWRVAVVKGNVGGSGSDATLRAQLSRPPVPGPTPVPTGTGGPGVTPTAYRPTPTGGPAVTPTAARPTPTAGPTPTGAGPTPTSAGPTPTPIPANPDIAFKMKYIHQDEQKTLVFEYHRQEAMQQSYNPNGTFELLLADLADRDRHFVEVDLDDPFFRVFAITITAPIDYAHIGLVEAHVSIDYGPETGDEQNHKHGDFLFSPADASPKTFQVYMNEQRETDYTYAIEYHFDPESGWDGDKYTISIPPTRTDTRNLVLNPYEQLGFLEVKVFPHRIDAQVVTSTDVHFSYKQPDGTVVEKVIAVTATSEPQFWRLRTNDPNEHRYTYYLVHHLKDGSLRQTDPVLTAVTSLPIDDPFDNALELDFIPLFDPTLVREVFIDVVYDDAANHYHRQERLTVMSNATDAVLLRIALFNPALRSYRYRLTYVLQGSMKRGEWVTTEETLIGLEG